MDVQENSTRNKPSDSALRKILTQPLYWAWAFVVIWLTHVAVTMFMQSWDGMTISLFGLLAALLVVFAIHSRRRKNLYPHHHHNEASQSAK